MSALNECRDIDSIQDFPDKKVRPPKSNHPCLVPTASLGSVTDLNFGIGIQVEMTSGVNDQIFEFRPTTRDVGVNAPAYRVKMVGVPSYLSFQIEIPKSAR